MLCSCIFIPSLVVLTTSASVERADKNWYTYKNSPVYQVYPRSFKDSNGDGIGDLSGIHEQIGAYRKHWRWRVMTVTDLYQPAVWLWLRLVANYTNVERNYGADFSGLWQTRGKSEVPRASKVNLDFLPNHSFDWHEWFQKKRPTDQTLRRVPCPAWRANSERH